MKNNKLFNTLTNASEYIMISALGILMIIQRFLSGLYKPVMDDWFLYGDLYSGITNRIMNFALPNEKFSIRPLAGIFDCFITAPLFEHLWIVELILTLSLLMGAFLIIKTLRKNNAAGAGFFLCIVCLYPVGIEATYWIAAATRVSCSMLFIGSAVFMLDCFCKTKQKKFLILYSIFGMLCVGFYEPAIVIYILLTLFIIWSNYKEKKDLLPVIIMLAHIGIIGLYYVLNSGSGEIESRGGFIKTDIINHTAFITDQLKKIFFEASPLITSEGYKKGLLIVLGGHKILKCLLIGGASLIFGIFSAVCIKKHKFSWKILLLGIALFFGGLSLNYVLNSDRLPLRLVFFSYLGLGIVIDEILALLPVTANRVICAVLLSLLSFKFTVAGIGEVRDYQKVYDYDTQITQQIIDLDTKHSLTNVNKNTYIFDGQHYYEETASVNWLDHIRGVSGNFADITGCMRHLTGVYETNNILPFTYGDTQILKPYIDTDGLCSFYLIEYNKSVVRASLVPNDENFDVIREDGSLAGTLNKTDNIRYQFFN